MNGAIVIEVPGPQGKQLASTLKNNLEEVLGDDARVYNPVAMGELRMRGIEPFTTKEEIVRTLESISESSSQDFKVSTIVNMRDGMRVAWVTCPLPIAVRIAERGSITLGWTRVRIDLLKKRPTQCFRCWRFGHVRANCSSEKDRTGTCFRCGVAGHAIGQCKASTPNCLICKDIECDSKHRLGSQICLRNHGFPVRAQPIRKRLVSTRKTSQSTVNNDELD